MEIIPNLPNTINKLYSWLIDGFLDKEVNKKLKNTLVLATINSFETRSAIIAFDFDQSEKDGIIMKLSRIQNNRYQSLRKTYEDFMEYRNNISIKYNQSK